MGYLATISSVGQITLPKEAREKLGVAPGDKVYLDLEEGRLVIEKRKDFSETLKELDKMREEEIKKNPEIKERIEKYAGMSASDVRRDWDASLEGRKSYEEEYGG